MGNSIGGRRRRVKVMKVDGETLKLKAPVRASEVLKDYPNHVLLDSEAVKHYGIRAKPLEPQQDLSRAKIYFLVQLPKISAAGQDQDQEKAERLPRRVRSSGVHISAKERLDLLMLSRRTMSEVSFARPSAAASGEAARFNSGPMQVKMRLPKSQVEKLMEESGSEGEVAEKIINMYIRNKAGNANGAGDTELRRRPQEQWKPSLVSGTEQHSKAHREKHVSFFPLEGEIGSAVAENQ